VGNESLDDLALLCDTCHQKRHPNKRITGKRKRRIKSRPFLAFSLASLLLFLLAILVSFV
jgi:hypothetical protein